MSGCCRRGTPLRGLLSVSVAALAGLVPPLGGDADAAESKVLPRVLVTGEELTVGTDRVPGRVMKSPRFLNVGEAILDLPGVSAVRRGGSAVEPVVRGMGWERVATQIGHLPLYGACPARMDPPITYVKPHSVQEVKVIRSLPSVTLGPAGNGGRIVVSSDYERSPGRAPEFHGELRAGYESNRRGTVLEGSLFGGNRWLDLLAAVETAHYDDYTSGDGTEVPANQDESGGSLSLGVRPAENHRFYNNISYVHEEDVDFPSLPMNIVETDYYAYTGGYRVRDVSASVFLAEVGWGYLDIAHVMNNDGKANRGMLAAETPSDTTAYSALAKLGIRVSEDAELTLGVDFARVERDAVRTRTLQMGPMAGQSFTDHLWPEAEQSDLGGFAELTWLADDAWTVRLGGRADYLNSEAGAAGDSISGKPIEQHWVAFYGPDASDFDREEWVGSGNAIAEWEFHPGQATHLGAGLATRAAGVTERFFAFAPAPGGFQVGNPALDPEKSYQLEWGLDLEGERASLSLSAYHYWVDDYILQTQIDRFDVNGDGSDDGIKGFRNVSARLYGGEAGATFAPAPHWQVPLTLAYVRGRNTSEDRDLPEIPPLEATAAVVVAFGQRVPWSLELGGRFVARQTQVDEQFPEDETGGFSVFHARGGADLTGWLRLETGVENLLDREYSEHLTREALFSDGDLATGDEVPSPGRSVHVSLQGHF